MQDDRSRAKEIQFQPIGIIRTPYKDWAPHQPVEREADKERFRLLLFDPLGGALKDLDSKPDADYGWIEDLEDREHLMLHIRGIPHHS